MKPISDYSRLGDAPQPPLGIAHLMLWMVVSAVFLTLDQYALRDIPTALRIKLQVYAGVLAIIHGAAVAMVPIWITRALRGGPPFPTAPGHFLGLLLAWNSVAQALASAAMAGLRILTEDGASASMSRLTLQLFVEMSLAPLALLSLMFCLQPTRWMVVFLVLALCNGMRILARTAGLMCEFQARYDGAYLWPQRALWLSMIAISAVLIAATAIDLARSRPRDWLHYVGVIATIAQAAAYGGFLLAMWIV
jgi:hypothetical protein